jgi:hypothetical protein
MQNNFWSLYKTYIIEVIVLVFFLAFGLYLYLDYSHRQILQENVVRQDILDEVNERELPCFQRH